MKKLSLGTKDEQVKELKKELKAAGYGQYISSEKETDPDFDLFNDNLLKSLTLFQIENNCVAGIDYRPRIGNEPYVNAGPSFEEGTTRREISINNGFYKVVKFSKITERYTIIVNGKRCVVPKDRLLLKKCYCDTRTWMMLKARALDNANRTDVFNKLKKATTATSVIANIGSGFAEGVNIVDGITSTAKAVVQNTLSGVSAITSIATNIFRDAPDFELKGNIVSITNITNPNNAYILYLPIIPETISVTKSSTWDSQTPMGRTSGYHGYVKTSDRSVSFSVDLYIRDFEDVDTYQKAINAILALSYPIYDSGKVIPPRCYVSIFGQLKFCGYCTSNNPSYKGDIVDGLYSQTSFSLSFTATSDVPFDAGDVLDKGELNSTINRFNVSPDNIIFPNTTILSDESRTSIYNETDLSTTL